MAQSVWVFRGSLSFIDAGTYLGGDRFSEWALWVQEEGVDE
jgi:hypothetical protein